MSKDTKKSKQPFQLGLAGAVVFFVIAVFMNIILPLKAGDGIRIRIWAVLDIIIWVYGFLNAFGYVKQIESKDEDGKIVYRTNVPIVQVVLLRIVQAGFYYWRYRATANIISFIILIILDFLITIFLFIDKGTYVFESIDVE